MAPAARARGVPTGEGQAARLRAHARRRAHVQQLPRVCHSQPAVQHPLRTRHVLDETLGSPWQAAASPPEGTTLVRIECMFFRSVCCPSLPLQDVVALIGECLSADPAARPTAAHILARLRAAAG